MNMLSNRSYLLRAFYDWIVDSSCTPILIIDATHPQCNVPEDYVIDGEIVFNISAAAVRDLKISNSVVEFKASFAGIIHMISAPVRAVVAVYAEENGEGLYFDADEEEDTSPPASRRQQQAEAQVPKGTSKVKPFLKLVE